ncbi:MAG: hypothetical protein GXP27_19180 [Planctomycetes bacterium]|nr:hypothetical protein [Planctomycetota bacterium]
MATNGERKAKVRAIALAALFYWARREQDRDSLDAGSETPVELTITGKVGRSSFAEQVKGRLQVGHDSTVASSRGPDDDHLLALVLANLSKKAVNKLTEELPAQFSALGELPPVDSALLSKAQRLRERLRTRTSTLRRGSVRLEIEQPVSV